VSAAVPSGVGFLGAGLVVQDIIKDEFTGHTSHTIKGIATAASVWLSAAVGIACGGGMYFSAAFTCALLMMLLRFGPRSAAERGASIRGKDSQEVLPIVTALLPERQEHESVKFRSGAQKQSLSFY
jgi:uncharacterized membrane protein YhiD involved in acid resistance